MSRRMVYVTCSDLDTCKIVSNAVELQAGELPDDDPRSVENGVIPALYKGETFSDTPLGLACTLNEQGRRHYLDYVINNYQVQHDIVTNTTTASIRIKSKDAVSSSPWPSGKPWKIEDGEKLLVGNTIVTVTGTESFSKPGNKLSATVDLTEIIADKNDRTTGTPVILGYTASEVLTVSGTPVSPYTEEQNLKLKCNAIFDNYLQTIPSIVQTNAVLSRASTKDFYTYTVPRRLFLMSGLLKELWDQMSLSQKHVATDWFSNFDTGAALMHGHNEDNPVAAWVEEEKTNSAAWDTWVDSSWCVVKDVTTANTFKTIGAEFKTTSDSHAYYSVSSISPKKPFVL